MSKCVNDICFTTAKKILCCNTHTIVPLNESDLLSLVIKTKDQIVKNKYVNVQFGTRHFRS